MALPAALGPMSPVLAKAGVRFGSAERPDERGLPLDDALDGVLPDGGLLRGGVVELAITGPSALATTIALHAVRGAQRDELGASSEKRWCAFVDPSSTLYAPGVAALGVDLERLLVVRSSLEALGRTAVKLAESPVFSLVVVDTFGTLGRPLDVPLGAWNRIVRRLSLAVDGTRRSVLLLTDARAPRTLPLPVAQRIELGQPHAGKLSVRIAKDRRGRISAPKEIECRHVA